MRSRLGGAFESWSDWLLCDRLIFGEAPPAFDPSPLAAVTAHPGGWHWRAQSAVRTMLGVAYSSRHLADDQAAQLLRMHPDARCGEPVTLRQGRWAEPWRGNCVAVGDAAVAVEPLEWTNLHLAHSAIDRIIAMMPDSECAPIELAEYSRQSIAEADRVRDFLLLHYLATDRQDPFWREAAAVEPPASLAHTLSLFRERGRLPFYEEETFTRDSWLAVLLGQGVRPRRVDPLVETTPAEQSLQTMTRLQESLAAMAPRLPTQRAFFQSITRQGAS
jgi:tryptophan halogenase